MDSREVTVHRVVNIVEKRPRPGMGYERGHKDNQWYGDPRQYQGGRGYHDGYPPNEGQGYEEDYGGYHNDPSPHRSEPSYYQQPYGQDDLRHQLSTRNRSRGYHPRKRGRGFGPPPREDHDYRNPKSLVITRERSPVRREAPPPGGARPGSNSSRTFSPDGDKGCSHPQTQQKQKSNSPSSSVETSSQISSKEKTSAASAAEPEEPEEAAEAAASTEPKLKLEENLKARRSEAIKAKVAEIEKHYQQDCETFRTVVKMLVAKEPSLDGLLQTPLDQNLTEIRQRCLDSLKCFVTELDQILEEPLSSA